MSWQIIESTPAATCPICLGEGTVMSPKMEKITCIRCKGSGKQPSDSARERVVSSSECDGIDSTYCYCGGICDKKKKYE